MVGRSQWIALIVLLVDCSCRSDHLLYSKTYSLLDADGCEITQPAELDRSLLTSLQAGVRCPRCPGVFKPKLGGWTIDLGIDAAGGGWAGKTQTDLTMRTDEIAPHVCALKDICGLRAVGLLLVAKHVRVAADRGLANHCTWEPGSHKSCFNLLASRVPVSVDRWMFLGDSTMHNMFDYLWDSDLHPHQSVRSCDDCTLQKSNRCNVAATLGLRETAIWKQPANGTEGPTQYGLQHPRCQDCSGCNCWLLKCKTPCNTTTASFLSSEFARDVEVQTPLAGTTQENMALWLAKQTSGAFEGKLFICVMGVGLHDMTLGPSKVVYTQNVRWFLKLLEPFCEHIVWVTMTAPKTEDYHQKTHLVEEWNEAVKVMLSEEFAEITSVVDVFEVSKIWPHGDNIHLEHPFYSDLALLFASVMQL